MVERNKDLRQSLERRVVVSGETLMDQVKLPEVEKNYLKNIGLDMLEWGAIQFEATNEDYDKVLSKKKKSTSSAKAYDEMFAIDDILSQKKINTLYLMEKNFKDRPRPPHQRKIVYVVPHSSSDSITWVFCSCFGADVYGVAANQLGVNFCYKDAIIKIQYTKNFEGLKGILKNKRVMHAFERES